jgi:hypothetical protein
MVALNETRRSRPSRAAYARLPRENPPPPRSCSAPRSPSVQRARYYDPSTGEFTSRLTTTTNHGTSPYRNETPLISIEEIEFDVVADVGELRVLRNCGEAEALTEWSIVPVNHRTDSLIKLISGLIVHKVDYYTFAVHCESGNILDELYSYFEVWEVQWGEVDGRAWELDFGGRPIPGLSKGAIDHWRTRELPKTKGIQIITGQYEFILGATISTPPWTFIFQPGYITLGGGLPIIDAKGGGKPPGWIGNGPIRGMVATWNCCECDSVWPPWFDFHTTKVSGINWFDSFIKYTPFKVHVGPLTPMR